MSERPAVNTNLGVSWREWGRVLVYVGLGLLWLVFAAASLVFTVWMYHTLGEAWFG